MKKIFSLSIAAIMAASIPMSASAATTKKIDLNKTIINGRVCVGENFKFNCSALPNFNWETIFPGSGNIANPDCNNDQNTTPDTNLPEQDNNKPETNLPEQDNNQNNGGQDSIVPPSSPEVELPENNDTPNVESAINEFEREVIRLVNQIRVENGLSELETDEELSRVARIKSQDMKDNGYFSHTSPTYGSPFDMMQSFGISYSSAGENIAKGQSSPQAVVNAWMNSSGHRANILNSSYTAIGVGYVAGGNYWTQLFVGR